MKVAFFKNGKGIFDRLVRWWTKSPYSHCELFFPDDGTLIGSVPRIGVREQRVASLDPESWDLLDIPLDPTDEAIVRTWCRGELGSKYDWFSIFFSQVLHIPRSHPDKWYCSEFCAAALQQVSELMGVKPCTLDPGELHDLLVHDADIRRPA